MAIDLSNPYPDIAAHVDHEIECVSYAGGQNVAIECVECGLVLFDADRPED